MDDTRSLLTLAAAEAGPLLDEWFDAARVGLALLDRDLRPVRVNPALEQLDGRPLERLAPLLRRALDGEVVEEVDAGGESGGRRWLATCFPVRAGAEDIQGVAAVVIEITAGRRAQTALNESRERLALVLDLTGTGYWEWEMPTGAVTWSPTLGPLHGLERGAVVEEYEHYMALVHPEDREPLARDIAAATESGRPYEREYRAVWPDGSVHWLQTRAEVLRGDDGRPRTLVGLINDISDRKRRELGREFLAQASLALIESAEPEAILGDVVGRAVPALADHYEVRLGDDPVLPGEPAIEAAGRRLVLPVVVRGRRAATISLSYAGSGREYGAVDLELGEELARRTAFALANAELHRAEREARSRLERVNRRLNALQSLTDVGLSHLDLQALLDELLARITQITATDAAAILLLDEEHQELAVAAAVGVGEDFRRAVRVPLGQGVAGGIAARRMPLVIDDIDAAVVHSPRLRELGKSLAGVPLLVDGQVLGVLHISAKARGAFGAEDVQLLELVADRAARAILNARLYEQARGAALTLQRSLLPGRLPDLEGLRFAARYQPASVSDAVGGDWYDALPLADGRCAVIVGDVMGRGIPAAAVMGQVRTAMQAYAAEAVSPADALMRLDRLLDTRDDEWFATALVLYVDPVDGRMTACSAGHPPPLLVGGGEAAYLSIEPGPPLGAPAGPRRETDLELLEGATLVMYTDGLVEDRSRPLDEGLADLARHAAGAPLVPAELIDRLLAGMLPRGAHVDDVAVLVLQRDR